MDSNQSESKIELMLSSNNPIVVTDTLLAITFNSTNREWVENQCLSLISNKDENISGMAITCLGHLARIHSAISKSKILPVLKKLAKQDNLLAGRAQDALDDIKMFAR